MPPEDSGTQPAAPVAPAPEESAAPAAVPESTAASPQIEQPAAPAEEPAADIQPAAAPSEPEAQPAESPAEPPTLKPHTDTPTLMELAGKDQPQSVPGEPPSIAEPQARTYEAFTLPDGLNLDQGRITEAATTLFAPDNLPQERAQAYLDFHIAEMERFANAERQAQHDTFATMRADQVKRVMADPEIGGNGHQTAMRVIAEMRDLFVSTAEPTSERYAQEMREFNEFLRTTGSGDWLAFNRFLHNVGRKFHEPAAPSITFRPPPDIGRRLNGSRRSVLYGEVQVGPNGQR